jgi:aryl-alcohol dehydrogenase-like predicted oxidoreductase
MWDYTTPVEEVMRGLDDLVQAGKIHYAGISDTPAWVASYGQAIAELRGWSRLVAYQAEYNVLERGVEADVLPMSRALEIAVLTFNLLSGGALTGKFNRPGGPGEPTRADRASESEQAAAEVIVQIAKEIGHTPAQVAINWVRQQAENIIPILGARRLPQIQDNLGVLEFSLSSELLQRLGEINPQPVAFPHSFDNDYVRRELILGERVDQLEYRKDRPALRK